MIKQSQTTRNSQFKTRHHSTLPNQPSPRIQLPPILKFGKFANRNSPRGNSDDSEMNHKHSYKSLATLIMDRAGNHTGLRRDHEDDMEHMDAKDFISKINSQVDVVKFMRLKGINLNDKKQREKIAANQKEFIEKFKSKELFKEAAIRNNQATFESVHLSREQIEKQRRIQKMQQRVNDHFKNNPIKLHGIGLPDNFFKLFDQQTEQEQAMEKKQKLAKHQQWRTETP